MTKFFLYIDCLFLICYNLQDTTLNDIKNFKNTKEGTNKMEQKLKRAGIATALISLLLLLTGLPVGAETSGNFTYTVSADGTAMITGYSSNESDVVIPDTLDGHRVTGIGGEAFYNRTDIRTLTIPSSILRIGGDTFINAGGITDVYYTGTRLQWHQIDIKHIGFRLIERQCITPMMSKQRI